MELTLLVDGGLLRKKGIKKVCVNDLQLHYKPPKTTLIYLSLFFGLAILAELSWDHVSQLCLQPLVVQLVMDSLVHHSQSGALVKDPVMAWALDFFPHGVSFHLADGLVHMAAVF